MALPEHEQRILDQIEEGLRSVATAPAALPAAVRTLIGLVTAVVALVIVVTLIHSAAAGLMLLIGCGLLGIIGYLHRDDRRHPA